MPHMIYSFSFKIPCQSVSYTYKFPNLIFLLSLSFIKRKLGIVTNQFVITCNYLSLVTIIVYFCKYTTINL